MGNERIVVVNGDSGQRRMICRALSARHQQVCGRADARSGLDLLETIPPPAAIVCDIDVEFARTIHSIERLRDVPIIFVQHDSFEISALVEDVERVLDEHH